MKKRDVSPTAKIIDSHLKTFELNEKGCHLRTGKAVLPKDG